MKQHKFYLGRTIAQINYFKTSQQVPVKEDSIITTKVLVIFGIVVAVKIIVLLLLL